MASIGLGDGLKPAQSKARETLVQWIRPHSKAFVLGILCATVVIGIDVALPLLFGEYLVDDILIAQDNVDFLGVIALAGIGLVLMRGLFMYGGEYLLAYVGQRVVYGLRARLYRHLLDMPLGQHAKEKSGSLVSRMTSDIGVIQNAVTAGIGDLVKYSLKAFGIVVMLFVVEWRLALLSMLTLPVAALAIRAYGSQIRGFTSRLQERIAGLTSTLQESLEGIRVVKAFRMEGERRARFDQDNRDSFRASMKSVQAMATVTPVVELIVVCGMMLVIWYGGRLVIAGEMTPGGLVAFLAYLGMFTQPISHLTRSFNLVQQAASAGDRVRSIMQTPVEESGRHETVVTDRISAAKYDQVEASRSERNQLKETGSYGKRPDVKGRVEFRNVSFSYVSGRPVLKKVSFVAEPGETIAFVGPSGAGKSTLVNLLPRFYHPDSGTITLDDTDISQLELGFLRRCIGLVPQETLLFGMTVAENIAAGRDWIDRGEVEAAAKLANAHEFIMELPQGYDTVVGERGASLSGGQRQRVAIARAVAGDPRILILDEATSALDPESERLVRLALQRARRDRTTLVIAHRLSTVQEADKIVVLEEGEAVEIGPHEYLLANGRVYPRLFQTQFVVDETEETDTAEDAWAIGRAADPAPSSAAVQRKEA